MAVNFSSDLWFEILSHLPVISLLRFKSVSKSFYNLISSPSFIAKHLNTTYSSSPINLLAKTITWDGNIFFDRLFIVSYETMQVIERNPFPIDEQSYSRQVAGSCNGLVCLYNTVNGNGVIWNPATGQTKVMPRPLMRRSGKLGSDKVAIGFGYDEKYDDYKVFLIHLLGSEAERFQLEIYSLKNDSWSFSTVTQGMLLQNINEQIVGAYDNGMISWLVLDHVGYPQILSFDISKEEIIMTPLPSEAADAFQLFSEFTNFVGVFNGLISVLIYIDFRSGSNPFLFDMWVLGEVGEAESWRKAFAIGFPHPASLPLAIWNEGLVIREKKDKGLFFYDPANQQTRRIGIPRNRYRFMGSVTYRESLVSSG